MAAAMAASVPTPNRTGRQVKDVKKDIFPLTKFDVQNLQAATNKLQPFQDEKRDIYQREHDDMSAAFDEAREGRGVLAKLYEQRNNEVLDRLVAMRKKTDREAKKQLDRLKAFSKEFEDTTSRNKKSWKAKFVADQTDITTRSDSVSDDIFSLDAAIAQEHEDCLAHAAAETEPLLEALTRHKEFLAEQVEERGVEFDRFVKEMEQRFVVLRKRLDDEVENRREANHAIRERTEEKFRSLEARIVEKEPRVRKDLEDCRTRLVHELQTRTMHQAGMVADMMRFMADFEESISEAGKRQEKAKEHLMRMRAMLRDELD